MRYLFPMMALLILSGCGKDLPAQKQVDVPFTSQAPAGNWSEPWQNACEETSIYMVSSFYADDDIKREEAITKIKEIVKTKNETFSVSEDESMQKIADLIKELGLPWHAEVKYDPSIDDLKAQLAEDHPIIVPVYAPELGNPYYDGVDYHVVVLIGYDDTTKEFIINDPGTEHGQGLRFGYDTFMNAIHDLNQKDYASGKKAVLITKDQAWQGW